MNNFSLRKGKASGYNNSVEFRGLIGVSNNMLIALGSLFWSLWLSICICSGEFASLVGRYASEGEITFTLDYDPSSGIPDRYFRGIVQRAAEGSVSNGFKIVGSWSLVEGDFSDQRLVFELQSPDCWIECMPIRFQECWVCIGCGVPISCGMAIIQARFLNTSLCCK